MDLATLIGFCSAVAVVVMAVAIGGNLSAMFDVASILIVFCGSAGVVLMRFSLAQFFNAIKVGLIVLFYKQERPSQIIDQVLELADIARKNGVLALEDIEIKNEFLKKGIDYVVDGLDAEIIETMLTKDMMLMLDRHVQGQQIFKALAEVGPAMGMIGTLIGLVQMLSNMSDPTRIGPSMALAMLTTLYGAVLANLIANPIADKLELRSKEERNIKALIIDAILCIQKRQNPRIINDILKIYLPGSQRAKKGSKKHKGTEVKP